VGSADGKSVLGRGEGVVGRVLQHLVQGAAPDARVPPRAQGQVQAEAPIPCP